MGIVLLLMLAFPAAAQAQLTSISYTATSDGHGGLIITAFSASGSGPLVIPSTITALPVTGIAADAFLNNASLTSVTIPNSVTSIGQDAFFHCSNLTSVTIPGSVTSIGNYAFEYCTNLTSIAIPNGVTSIGSSAFYESAGLTSVTLPTSVTSIGTYAFGDCVGLTSITVSAQNSAYSSSVDGVLFDKNQTTLIQYPTGSASTSYTIPGSVTSIGIDAFESCTSLTSVTIPNSVTSIGADAFFSCTSLTSMTIPNGVTSIGANAFQLCTSMTSVTIPNSLSSIAASTFQSCTSLTSVTIPGSVSSISNEAFYGCISMTNAIFQGNAPTMGGNVFLNTPGGFTVDYYNGASGFTSPIWTPDANDSYSAVNLGYYPGGPFSGSSLGSGWYYSAWFGTYNTTYYPWIYRSDLGFIYVDTSDNTNLYLYVVNGNSGSMGWLYTTQAQFPNVYSFSRDSWLSYDVGTTDFYNYSTQAWETY